MEQVSSVYFPGLDKSLASIFPPITYTSFDGPELGLRSCIFVVHYLNSVP